MDFKYLTPDYMFTTPSGTPSVYFDVLVGIFVVIFLASAFAYWRRAKLAGGNPVLRRFIRRVAKAGLWTSAIGIVLCLMLIFEIPYIGMPIWLDLLGLTMIGIVGYFVYERSERYPLSVWRLQESEVVRRYRPATRPRPEPQRVRPTRARGKGRRR